MEIPNFDELMQTQFGKGISRSVKGSPGAYGTPVSMEDTRRKAALIQLRAADEEANRPHASPELAMKLLQERVPGQMEEGGFRPSPGVHTTPIDQEKAGAARAIREHVAKQKAMQRLGSFNKHRIPLPVAQDAAFMNHIARNPRLAPALLEFRTKQAQMQQQGQMGMLAHQLGVGELNQRGSLAEKQFGNQLEVAKIGNEGLGEERKARAAFDNTRAKSYQPPLGEREKFMGSVVSSAVESGQMTPEEAMATIGRLGGQGGAAPPAAGGIPSLPKVADPSAAIEQVFSAASAVGKEPTREDFAKAGVSPDMLERHLAEIEPRVSTPYSPGDPITGLMGLVNRKGLQKRDESIRRSRMIRSALKNRSST